MIAVRSAIQKGRRFQKKTMETIKAAFGFGDEEIRVPVGAESGMDIKVSKRALLRLGLAIECKNKKNLNIWSAIEQAKKNCVKGVDPAVVFKRGDLGANKTYICIPFDHYLSLRQALLLYEEEKGKDS